MADAMISNVEQHGWCTDCEQETQICCHCAGCHACRDPGVLGCCKRNNTVRCYIHFSFATKRLQIVVAIMSSVPPTPTASCYICLENGTENGTLLRNCACRGDAGWAHVACLAKYSANKVVDARKKDPQCPILKYWNTCLLCKTNFMQNMGLAMASACVQQYEHLLDTVL